MNIGSLELMCISSTIWSELVNTNFLYDLLKNDLLSFYNVIFIVFELNDLGNFEIIWRKDVSTVENIPHMGMLILKNKWIVDQFSIITTDIINIDMNGKKLQYCKINIGNEMPILNVYINRTPANHEIGRIGEILRKENAKVILGDFNINPDQNEGFEKINNFEINNKMTQVNTESTRHNRTLDLIFRIIDMKELDFMPFAFKNLYSDHAAIGFRYCKDGEISGEYEEMEIRNQKKAFLRKKTLDEMEPESDFTERKKNSTKSGKKPQELHPERNESDPIIMECPRDVVRLTNLRKLILGEWVDSPTINCYLYLIQQKFEKVFTMETFFNIQLKTRNIYEIDRQFTKTKTKLLDYDLWIIPVNCTRTHWFLVTVDLKEIINKKIIIRIYDSLGELKLWESVFESRKMEMFIHSKYLGKYQLIQSPLEISTYDLSNSIPQQDNGNDCGVFCMVFSKYLAAGELFNFGPIDMPKFRKKIYNEISTSKLEDIFWDQEEEFDFPDYCFDKTTYKKGSEYSNKEKQEGCHSTPLHSSNKKKNDKNQRSKNEKNSDEENIDKEDKNPNKDWTHNKTSGNETFLVLKIYKFDNPPRKNLCFSNAVTTLLLNIKGIQDLLSENNPALKKNDIYRELKSLNQEVILFQHSTQNLRRIVQMLCIMYQQHTRTFDNNDQFDAAEFLSSLLEHLFKNNENILTSVFGKVQSTIFCTNANCNHVDQMSSNNVNIVVLQLSGPSLDLCLEEFLAPEDIKRNCPHCENNMATTVTTFSAFPKTIIFQLSRFFYSTIHGGIIKKRDKMNVPLSINLPGGPSYKLVGTINHYGDSANHGHYTCMLFHRNSGQFVLCDDEQITFKINSIDEKHSQDVYLVAYQQD